MNVWVKLVGPESLKCCTDIVRLESELVEVVVDRLIEEAAAESLSEFKLELELDKILQSEMCNSLFISFLHLFHPYFHISECLELISASPNSRQIVGKQLMNSSSECLSYITQPLFSLLRCSNTISL